MKKLLLFLLFSITLFASRSDTERKIYDTLIHAILPKEKVIYVWSDSKELTRELKKIKNIVLVPKLKEAKIAIVKKTEIPTQCSCLLFVTSYKQLKRYKDKAIGGFFWQKGRPNILFLKKNLQKEGVSLPKSMQQFIEEEL